ncbi:hypothetical protein V8C42DRAFT_158155 [Trichoderma barbatum]
MKCNNKGQSHADANQSKKRPLQPRLSLRSHKRQRIMKKALFRGRRWWRDIYIYLFGVQFCFFLLCSLQSCCGPEGLPFVGVTLIPHKQYTKSIITLINLLRLLVLVPGYPARRTSRVTMTITIRFMQTLMNTMSDGTLMFLI